MHKSFCINIKITPSNLLHKAKAMACATGWCLSGDIESGNFSRDETSGYYKRDGNSLKITMTSKPYHESWSDVEKELRNLY